MLEIWGEMTVEKQYKTCNAKSRVQTKSAGRQEPGEVNKPSVSCRWNSGREPRGAYTLAGAAEMKFVQGNGRKVLTLTLPTGDGLASRHF